MNKTMQDKQFNTVKECEELLGEMQSRLLIDKHNLDIELSQHADTYYAIAHEYTRCMAYRDQAKQDCDLAKANVDRQLREKYAADGAKVTEARLDNEVTLSVPVQNAQSEYAMWRHMTEAWQALRDAYSTRGYAIRDLVQLHIAGYYADAPVKAAEEKRPMLRTHGR